MKLEELSARIAGQNDELAFRELFEHFFPGLLSVAQSILKSRQLAEEVTEDVFIRLWENRSVLPTIKSLSYYLYVATRHACINALAKQKKHQSISIEDAEETFVFSFTNIESSLIENENINQIAKAINVLPPKCRLIFRLIKEEKLKYKEVALLLNLSEKTVEAHMTQALRKITAYLQDHLPEYQSHFLQKRKS